MSLDLLLAQFDGLIRTPADVAKLNETILDWAVRGKLVPQDPADEPASELLKRIAVEKVRLVEEGKIRAEKPLPPVREEEMPYELPASWTWASFSNIADFAVGKTPDTKQARYWDDDGFPWVSISDMTQYGQVFDTSRKVSQLAVDKVFRNRVAPAGTLLMSFKLTLGKVSVLEIDALHNEAIISIRPFVGILQDYLFRFLPVLVFYGNTKDAIKGATLNTTSLSMLLIPLPPTEEQRRIVVKVEELFAQTARLAEQLAAADEARRRLHTAALHRLTAPTGAAGNGARAAWELLAGQFDDLYTEPETIEALKQAILQLAVQGRLVSQDPHDEPASELLKRIAAEKARLVEEGKMRAGKPLPPVREEEMPYELPAGWVWVRLGHLLIDITAGKSFGANKYPAQKGELGVLKVSAVTWGKFQPEENKALFSGTKIEGIATVRANDVLISRANTSQLLGAVVLVDRDYPNLILSDKTLRLDFVADSIHKPFMVFALRAKWVREVFEKEAIGTSSSMQNISQQKIRFAPIALPPYSEQKRIVEMLKNLFAICDCLAEQVTAAEGARERLLAAALAGVRNGVP